MADYFDEDPNALSSDNASSSGDDSSDSDGPPIPPPSISQNFFAPPFYGRPPTPLPPSPSLTSLLRPSRPTTPDASDDEHALEPVPRASPKVPTYEYYGFVLYLFSSLAFLIYLLWAYLPSPFLHALNIYYYPNRWWALAIPAFLVMLIVYIYVALACYNTEYLTLPLGSLETVVDEAAMVACVDSRGRLKISKGPEGGGGAKVSESRALDVEWRSVWNRGTDGVMDVPLAGVNEVLYGYGGEHEGEEP
ncbi:putative PIG-P domain-containing protein [Seiridium cardinale]